jgi:hypothetical protein
MNNKVYSIDGKKMSSLVFTENGIRISSSNFKSLEEFEAGWDKKLSLATKTEIKTETIKSISKEDASEDVIIKYKGFANMSMEAEFQFSNSSDYDEFIETLCTKYFFQKNETRLSPFKAIQGYLLGLAISIGLTIFCYYQAIEIENGTFSGSHNRKGRAFENIVGMLGVNGVIVLGSAICLYIGYKIWTRYKNPPNQMQLLPSS